MAFKNRLVINSYNLLLLHTYIHTNTYTNVYIRTNTYTSVYTYKHIY